PAAEGLAPAVGAATPFGEDDEAPPVVEELGREVGRPAADASALDREGADGQCGDRPGDAVREEVVGARGHDGSVAEPVGERGQQKWGVEMALVVGGEDRRRLERLEAVEAVELR